MKQLVFHGMIWGYFSNFVLIIYKCNYLMINSCFFYLFRNYYILKWGYPQFLHFNRTFRYKQTMLGYLHLWNPPYIYMYLCMMHALCMDEWSTSIWHDLNDGVIVFGKSRPTRSHSWPYDNSYFSYFSRMSGVQNPCWVMIVWDCTTLDVSGIIAIHDQNRYKPGSIEGWQRVLNTAHMGI